MTALSLLVCLSAKAQSIEQQIAETERVKAEYGEVSPEYAESLYWLGRMYPDQGDAKAYECFSKSLQIYSNGSVSEFPVYYYDLYWQLACHYYLTDDYSKAAQYLDSNIAFLKRGYIKDVYVSIPQQIAYENTVRGDALRMQSLFDDAKGCYYEAAEIYRTELGDRMDDVYGYALKRAAGCAVAAGDYGTALPCLLREKQEMDSTGSTESDEYFSLLDDILLCYAKFGRGRDFEELFPTYKELARKLGKLYTDEYYDTLYSRSELLSLYSEDEAIDEVNSELLATVAAVYGKSSLQNLTANLQIAQRYENRDNHDKARSFLSECSTLLEKGQVEFELPVDSLLVAGFMHNLEGLILVEENSDAAVAELETAIDFFDKAGHSDYAPYNNLGMFYLQNKGDAGHALSFFLKARQILMSRQLTRSADYVGILNNIGLCYLNDGQYLLAISSLDEAENLALQEFGGQLLTYPNILLNKSLYNCAIKDFDSAISCAEASLRLFQKFYGEESDKAAITLNDIGLYCQNKKDYGAAEEHYLRSLEILAKNNSPYQYRILPMINLLGIYGIHKPDAEKMQSMSDSVRDMIEKNNLWGTDIGYSAVGTIGYVLLCRGNANATQFLVASNEILKNLHGDANMKYLETMIYIGLARIQDHSIDRNFGCGLVEKYKKLYTDDISGLNASERESIVMGQRFGLLKNVLFTSRADSGLDPYLYDFLLFNKGLLLETSVKYARAVYESGDNELIGKWQDMVELHMILRGERSDKFADLPAEDVVRMSNRLEREVTAEIQDRFKDDAAPVTYADVSGALKPKQAAVEFVDYMDYNEGKEKLAALVLTYGMEKPVLVPLCPAADVEKLAGLKPDVLYGATNASEELYGLVWKPLSPYIVSCKSIAFAPAGLLNTIAVEQLYDGKSLMGDRYDMRRVLSTRELCSEDRDVKHERFALYGGLQYDVDDQDMIEAGCAWNSDGSQVTNVFARGDASVTKSGWSYLPGTLSEVTDISETVEAARMDKIVYVGVNGNEESFKALSGKDISVLHIATHGFYIPEKDRDRTSYLAAIPDFNMSASDNAMFRSGLVMSGGNKAWLGEQVPASVEDGLLTAAEIQNLDLNHVDIAVLSACQTGLGDITDEGVLGLQRAFKNAGVNTIVMSLWNVDDRATSLMMTEFYKSLLAGKPKREAFSQAQSAVRKKYPSPSKWAAFVMVD